MNILQQEDIIKGLPDQALQEEAKSPSGQVPQFLVVSEIQRRTDMRKRYQDPSQQQPQGTITDQITQEGIASVQPQQPMQGEPMQMMGGGMTPFMRKYAGGGVVRMQEGGITPSNMIQIGQDGFFEQRIREAIAQGVDPSQLVNAIGSRFGPDAVQQAMSIISPQVGADDVANNFSNSMTEDAARSDNILATVNDATPEEAQAVNNPVSVNLPEKVNYEPSDALVLAREQAKKDAYLTDLYASVGREYKSPMISKILQENQSMAPDEPKKDSRLPERSALSSISDVFADIGSNVSSDMKKIGNVFGGSGTTSRGNILTSSPDAKDSLVFSDIKDVYDQATSKSNLPDGRTASNMQGALSSDNPSAYEVGQDAYEIGQDAGSAIKTVLPFGDLYRGAYNTTADLLEPIEDFGRGITGANKRRGQGFRYDTRGLFQKDDSGKTFYFDKFDSDNSNLKSTENLINFAEQQGSPSRQELIDANSIKNISNADTDDANNVVTGGAKNAVTDGANARGSGSEKDKIEDKLNPFLSALNLDLDESKKEAFAMAMIQLGAGIAEGDLSKGLSNAGVAASGVLEKSRDRQDKQLDRQIQTKYYDDKLADSQEMRSFRINQAVENALNDWKESNFGATKEQIDSKRKELMSQFNNNLGDTITTGDNLGGGNQRGEVVNFDKDGNRI